LEPASAAFFEKRLGFRRNPEQGVARYGKIAIHEVCRQLSGSGAQQIACERQIDKLHVVKAVKALRQSFKGAVLMFPDEFKDFGS
jgi:hypothetical protein